MDELHHRRTALIVDVSATFRSVLRRAFDPTVFDVYEESTGKDALRNALNVQPDVITLSISLPDADGIEICAAIVNEPALASSSVVMVTSNESPKERARAFEAGAVRFASKDDPITDLAAYVDDIVRSRDLLSGSRIVVVDDSKFIRTTVSHVLASEGARVFCVDGALQALEVLEENDVDVVITDYYMPDMDGIELVQRIRATRSLELIPVLFLSGADQRKVIVRALDAGANDFIHKPFEATELLARARSFVRISELTRKLQHLATIDELTQMLNRREVMARFEEYWGNARRNEAELCCIIADIDHFKRVNDTLGHAAGDSLLQQISHMIMEFCGDSWICGRVGGEEFLVICPAWDLNKAHQRAQKLCETIADHSFEVAGSPLNATISVGVASMRASMDGISQILQEADEALYQAKSLGRNRVERSALPVVTR